MAKKRTHLWWATEEGSDGRHLTDDPKGYYSSTEKVKVDDLDSYDLADFLDQEAENENRHELVGVHAKLAKIIRVEAGEDHTASKVMQAITKAGGLWNMA